jgi:hypothetical protein
MTAMGRLQNWSAKMIMAKILIDYLRNRASVFEGFEVGMQGE